MKTSAKISEEIILYLRFQDRHSAVIDEALNKLLSAYDEAKTREKNNEPK